MIIYLSEYMLSNSNLTYHSLTEEKGYSSTTALNREVKVKQKARWLLFNKPMPLQNHVIGTANCFPAFLSTAVLNNKKPY